MSGDSNQDQHEQDTGNDEIEQLPAFFGFFGMATTAAMMGGRSGAWASLDGTGADVLSIVFIQL